ncbi:M14 family metallopeptidase [Haladaptatus caseinilyticus]|uniref:deacylase n=1 Tax=Haladaptatus caseinilyticus TaxID=2993314 RepID=UPI00224AE614|nr:deacylase [Haladaptatus caseinilyticus]
MESNNTKLEEKNCSRNDDKKSEVSNQSRRSFITKSAGVIAASTFGINQAGSVVGEDDEFCPIRQSHSEDTLLEGTEEEVKIYTTESRIPGPTAVVVGGVQGNEPATWNAAHQVKDWSINSGKLVVLPEINPVAIERGTYINDNGDLNDQFPPGQEPTTELAQVLWEVIEQANPDVFFSLHTSRGILHEFEGPSGVGQAIYPTYIDSARSNASRTVEYMNQQLESFRSIYDFKVGNTLYGTRPLLTHKVGADLEIPGFLVEATRYRTKLETRVEWETAIVANLLEQNGMKVSR